MLRTLTLLASLAPISIGVAQPRIAVDPTPITDVRGTSRSGDLVFESAAGATRLSDGTIVVADRTGATIRFFDARGTPVRSVGRSGAGPGEFRMPSWIAQCGADSVFVFDPPQGRMTVIAASSEVVRQYRVPAEAGTGPPPHAMACSRSGTFVLLGRGGGDRVPVDATAPGVEVRRYRGPLSLADASGNVTRALGEATVGEFIVMGGGGAPRPLGASTSLAVSGDRVYVGTSDSAVVRVFAVDGRTLSPLDTRLARRRSVKADHDRAVDAVLAMAPARAVDRVRTLLASVPMPEHLPAFTSLHADPHGNLWIAHEARGGTAVALRAIAPDGRVLGDAALPVALTVLEIGSDHVLGTYDDDEGETHVVAYRVSHRR